MKLAPKSLRISNLLIDSFVVIIIGLIVELISDLSGVIGLFIYMSYYFVLEVTLNKTAGKYCTKTKVVNRNGEKPSALNIVTRTVCRVLPFDALSFLFGTYGLHDKYSRTEVIVSK